MSSSDHQIQINQNENQQNSENNTKNDIPPQEPIKNIQEAEKVYSTEKKDSNNNEMQIKDSTEDLTQEKDKPQNTKDAKQQQLQSKEVKKELVQVCHTFDTFKDYTIPQWSAPPKNNYYFEVLKQGMMLNEVKLYPKPFYLIGKYKDLSDIVMEHPTISRKHAILQHKNDGALYIYDLGSTQGTFLNKKKIPKKSYCRLKLNDLLQFGSSTRMYILRCDELEEKETDIKMINESIGNKNQSTKTTKEIYLELLSAHNKQQGFYTQNKNKQKKVDKCGDGISWGMVDEDLIYEQQEQETELIPEVLRQLPNLTIKQIQKIDQYDQKFQKYTAAENEINDLTEKERKQFGLEEKQKQRKEALEDKLRELSMQLDSAEDQIRIAFFNEKSQTTTNMISKIKQTDSFEDDEYLDRTLTQSGQKTDEQLMNEYKQQIEDQKKESTDNYYTLQQKLKYLIEEKFKLKKQFEQLQASKSSTAANENKETKIKEEEELDEFEKYMQQNENLLEKQNQKIHEDQLSNLQNEIEKVKKILMFIKPDIKIHESSFLQALEKKDQQKSYSNPNTQKEFSQPKSQKEAQKQQQDQSQEFQKPSKKIEQKQKEKDIQQEQRNQIKSVLKNLKQKQEEKEYDELDEEAFKEIELDLKIQSLEDEEENAYEKQQQFYNNQRRKKVKQQTFTQTQEVKNYKVMQKPISRNIKETEEEQKDTVVWAPPSQKSDDKLNLLKKKLNY